MNGVTVASNNITEIERKYKKRLITSALPSMVWLLRRSPIKSLNVVSEIQTMRLNIYLEWRFQYYHNVFALHTRVHQFNWIQFTSFGRIKSYHIFGLISGLSLSYWCQNSTLFHILSPIARQLRRFLFANCHSYAYYIHYFGDYLECLSDSAHSYTTHSSSLCQTLLNTGFNEYWN